MVAVSNWMHVDYFTVEQASALWCEVDPVQLSISDSMNPSEVVAVKQLLTGAIISGELIADSTKNTYNSIGDYSKSLVERWRLEKFARSKNLFPAFLFDTLAPFAKPESPLERFNRYAAKMAPILQPQVPVNQGGRPPEYDWDSFMLEIIRRANTLDGLPDSQADLIRHMQLWFSDTFDAEPAESSIKARISKIYKYLTDAKAKAENPDA